MAATKKLSEIETFGKRLKRLRVQNNLSHNELAELAGTGKGYLANFEGGFRQPPKSGSVIQKLADIFQITVNELLTGEKSPEAPEETVVPQVSELIDRVEVVEEEPEAAIIEPIVEPIIEPIIEPIVEEVEPIFIVDWNAVDKLSETIELEEVPVAEEQPKHSISEAYGSLKLDSPLVDTRTLRAERPTYYNGDECLRTIAAMTKNLSGVDAFVAGNVVKYMWRFQSKNGIEDLKKAREYMDMLILEKQAQEHDTVAYIEGEIERMKADGFIA